MVKLGLTLVLAPILILLCSYAYGLSVGEKPTFTECRPHIDATIRNLAATAVKSGAEPTEPQSEDYASPEENAEISDISPKIEKEPEIKASEGNVEINKAEKETEINGEKHHDYLEKEVKEKSVEKNDNERYYQEKKGDKYSKNVVSKKGKDSDSKTNPGLFNQIVYTIFGVKDDERDPKYSTPWTTHKEFIKVPKETKKKIVDQGPGIFSRSINKCVHAIFGLSEQKRDSKWSKPWQTHVEHMKLSKPAKTTESKPTVMPWERKSLFNLSFMNSFIEMIFGKHKSQRDEKFSKPWTTHKEFKKMKPTDAKKVDTKTKEVLKSSEGGIINYFVSLVFEVPKGTRDSKWKTPWQSHQEFKKVSSAKPKTVNANKSIEFNGFIGNLLNNAVFSIFGKVDGKRSSKWNEPWQTHKEFLKATKKPPPTKESLMPPGIISRSITSGIEMIFGKCSKERESKWATPWQSHKEFTKNKHKIVLEQDILKHSKSPTDKKVHSEAPTVTPKYVKTGDTNIHKQPDKPVYEEKERKDYIKPSVETKSSKPVEKETLHSTHKDVRSAPLVKITPEPVADIPKKTEKPHLEKTREKKERVIEYDEQIVVVPSHVRSRNHIEDILGLHEISSQTSAKTEHASQVVLNDLKDVYQDSISPLEKIYKYHDISNRHLSDAELHGPPILLLLGPYSTGKSSFINYLLGVEFTKRGLKTGTPPSHGVFRIIQHGEHDRQLDGTEVCGQWLFSSLQKFGQNFVDQIKGNSLNIPLLKKVTFVEAPGILEMRRPNERLYPLNDVLQWFIDRADLILVMFDYTKLDAGFELEAILDQLKGRESQTRILLNKADQVPPEELIKVQGTLFWNLSPLLGVNSPPTVYAGSYASFPYRPTSPIQLFEAQEEALLHDIASAFKDRVNNRIANVRRHAVRVRNHAYMVDTYLNTFYKNKGFLTSKHKLAEEIIDSPHDFNIYEGLTLKTNVSRYDLPDAEVYRDFFRIHNLYDFQTLRQTCTYVSGCPMDKIDAAVNKRLPALMKKFRHLTEAVESNSPPKFNHEKNIHAREHAHPGKY